MSKVIIFPTDTVYGIGCSIYDKDGQNRIYEIKHRSHDKPLAVLCASLEQIKSIAVVNELAEVLIKKFLPGQVTFILLAKPEIAEILGFKTIGVRIPNANLALEILEKNGPMTTTSVNESGEKPLDTYEEIYETYNSCVDHIYKKDFESSSVSSSVIDLTSSDLKILREGNVTLSKINEYLIEIGFVK